MNQRTLNPRTSFLAHMSLQADIDDGSYDVSSVRKMLDGKFMPIEPYTDVLDPTNTHFRLQRLHDRMNNDYSFEEDLVQDRVVRVISQRPVLVKIQPAVLRSDLAATGDTITSYCVSRGWHPGFTTLLYWVLWNRDLQLPRVVALDSDVMIDDKLHLVVARPRTPDNLGSVFTMPYDTVWPAGTGFVLWRYAT